MNVRRISAQKRRVLQAYATYVSSAKARFFYRHVMDFVIGGREGPWLCDMDGAKRVYNLHCNGGVFNLGHRDPRIRAALAEAMEEMLISNHHLMSRARVEVASHLAELLPRE